MFGFIAAIFKGLFSILFMGLFIVADALREFLEDIGKDLFNFPEIWIFILFGFFVFLVIKLIRWKIYSTFLFIEGMSYKLKI